MDDNFGVPPHKTISQIIEDLQKIQAEHGDLPVCALYEEEDGFCFDFDQIFDMVEMPEDSEIVEPRGRMIKLCCFTWPEAAAPHLKVVEEDT